MVSSKKSPRKVSRTKKKIEKQEAVVESVKKEEETLPCPEGYIRNLDTGKCEEVEIVEEPQLTIKYKPEPTKQDYKNLLVEAPDIPYITTVEDAVQFVDKYAKWKRKVKAST